MNKTITIIIGTALVTAVILSLVYFVLIPEFNNYIKDQREEAQLDVINTLIALSDTQGYAIVNNGDREVILIKYQPEQNETSRN